MKNANINSRFVDLMEVLDARATVSIFEEVNGRDAILRTCKVYEVLGDEAFMSVYKNFAVVGLVFGMFNNVLIKKEM